MVWQGASYDIGVSAFTPRRSYHATGTPSAPPGTACGANCPFSIGDGDQKIDSENELFLIPQFGYNWALGTEKSIGVSVFGNGGMNTEYKGGTAILGTPTGFNAEMPGTFGDGTAGVNLEQLFVSTTYAAKITDSSSWGISAIVAYQRFAAKGLQNFQFYSNNPDKLSNNGTDTSYGLGIRLGFQAEVASGVRVGAAYQPKINMSEFDDYSGLFAEEGDFDIPSNYTLGIAVDVGSSGTILVDYQGINYEDVAAVSNPIAPLTDPSKCTGGSGGSGCLGGKDGAGFGWKNMGIIKLGYQWKTGKNTWRLGYSHANQPIPSSEVTFNILAPGVIEDHFTFGFERDLNAKSSISFAAMYAPSSSVKGENTFDPNQDIELEMDQYELAIAYNRRLF